MAVEVLTELVSRHEGLPQVLLPRMLDVKDGLLMPALAAGEENVIRGVATLIAELGQAAPALVAQGSREALDLAESLLRCVSFPSCDWEIAESTLQFWCTLAEYLVSCEDTSAALPTFIPVYSALLEALIVRAQWTSRWTCSISEKFGRTSCRCLPLVGAKAIPCIVT